MIGRRDSLREELSAKKSKWQAEQAIREHVATRLSGHDRIAADGALELSSWVLVAFLLALALLEVDLTMDAQWQSLSLLQMTDCVLEPILLDTQGERAHASRDSLPAG